MTLPAFIQSVATWAAGGVGIGAGAAGGVWFVKWFIEWIGGRVDKKEEAVERGFNRLDEGTQKLISHLETQVENLEEQLTKAVKRIDGLERDLKECRDRHAECEAEVARLKAMMQGYGDARQHAQRIVAVERLEKEARK